MSRPEVSNSSHLLHEAMEMQTAPGKLEIEALHGLGANFMARFLVNKIIGLQGIQPDQNRIGASSN